MSTQPKDEDRIARAIRILLDFVLQEVADVRADQEVTHNKNWIKGE